MTSGSSYVAFILMKKTHSGTSMLMNHWIIGGANHIPSRGQGSYQRSLNDRKGRQAIASVLCKLCPTRARGQLHPHGKIGISLSQRKQTAKKGITRPRTSIKGQILADFIVERLDEESPDELMAEPEELPKPWTLFEATNNEVEYEALIAGLRIAEQMGVKNLQANLTLLVSKTRKKAVHEREVLAIVEEEEKTWMTPIYEYLTKEILPEDKKKARVHALRSYIRGGQGHPDGILLANNAYGCAETNKGMQCSIGNQVKKFVWDNILCRFGLPGEIVSDNGKQFRDNPFKDCTHKQMAWSKGQTGVWERESKLDWMKEARIDRRYSYTLGHTITMIKSSNGETPFSLTYGTEVVIPAEIGMPTLRTAELDLTKNDEALGINLDLIEEKREQAAIQEAKSKAKMEKYYNSKVQSTSFRPGEMVYRSNDASHAKDGGKLGPKWEGPYEVTESLGKGAYKLKDQKGNELPRTWNICNLKKCYIHEV
ncbi:reverse transcriptase domain-containing protein [Tanacetum coccineum]